VFLGSFGSLANSWSEGKNLQEKLQSKGKEEEAEVNQSL
jgi:hypothetical protein